MITKLTIKEVKAKPFKTANGDEIGYFWHRALRKNDGVTIQFGSKRQHTKDQEVEVDLVKEEIAGGKFRYKEIIETE